MFLNCWVVVVVVVVVVLEVPVLEVVTDYDDYNSSTLLVLFEGIVSVICYYYCRDYWCWYCCSYCLINVYAMNYGICFCFYFY